MNKQEIIGLLKKVGSISDFVWGTKAKSIKLGDYQIEFVDGYIGEEGGVDNMYAVFKIIDQQNNFIYVQTTGYYNSWDGTEWHNDWTEVFQKTKVVTYYE